MLIFDEANFDNTCIFWFLINLALDKAKTHAYACS